jgi:hypothetical protein
MPHEEQLVLLERTEELARSTRRSPLPLAEPAV